MKKARTINRAQKVNRVKVSKNNSLTSHNHWNLRKIHKNNKVHQTIHNKLVTKQIHKIHKI